MEHHLKPGDLVKFSKDPIAVPPEVIPLDTEMMGMVINVDTKLIGSDSDPQAIMTTVLVKWSDPKWNSDKGFSEEYMQDLVLVQRGTHYTKQ